MKKFFALLILIVAVFGLYLWGERAAERYRSQQIARSSLERLSVGMTRSDAVALLEDEAWHHAVCERSEHYVEDLFLYGSHNLELTSNVMLRSELQNGEMVVKFIGQEESYRLFLYDDCSSLDLNP